ncbi:MarR family transcriptional regulator [Tersicoccus sp. MR15.9]|uniref:MarR family winged helix-turn-helix transcriptional regulator n=1 Tax=Tersicoccus mangrovi TaxID=3121635 RepID=UPI002FE67FC9
MQMNADAAGRLSIALERLVRSLRTAAVDEALSPSAAAVLSRLDADGPDGITGLARAERVSQPSMTQLVARLVADDLVAREPSIQDRRSVVVSLTPAGRLALDERRQRRAARLLDALERLDAQARDDVASSLTAIEHLAGVLAQTPGRTR